MKKKFMGIALILASALFVGNVYAEEPTATDVADAGTLATCFMSTSADSAVCKLTTDITDATAVFTGMGKTITLDLNGHNITLPNSGASIMVTSGSSLTIKGDGKIFTQGTSGQAVNVLAGGSLTVLDASINSESGAAGIVVFGGGEKTNVSIGPDAKVSASSSIGGIAIMGGSGGTGDASNVNVSVEGTVTNNNGSAILIPSSVNKTENGATVDIKPGAKVSATGENGSAVDVSGYSNINVTGGTISSTNGYAIQTGDEGNINISGGDFQAPKQNSAISYTKGEGNTVTMSITGGDFSSLADDIITQFVKGDVTKDENGNIVIKPEPEPTPTPTPDPVPGTGDTIALGLVGVLALISACYVFKKNA